MSRWWRTKRAGVREAGRGGDLVWFVARAHQNRFKKMNRNISHRFTFESKRTFYFTKISTSFPLVTSCPTACPVSQGSDKPPPPILRYGTRPSTDRAVRVLPRRYRDHLGPPRLWWSDIHPDIGPVSQIDHQSTAPPARG